MKDPFYLTPLCNYENFFKKVKTGDLIEYSLSYTLKEVMDIAKRYKTIVEYADSKTREKYGSFIVIVVDKEKADVKTKPVFFDTNFLDV